MKRSTASWLIFAEGSVYNVYDTAFRLWGVSVTSDQQVAGLIMKLVGGFYLWTVMAVVFFRWAYGQQSGDPVRMEATRTARPDPVAPDSSLTYGEVEAAFAAAGDAAVEQHSST